MNATSTLLAQILTSVVNECLLAAERRKTPLTWSLPSSKLAWRNLLKLESIGIFLIPLVLYQKFSLLYFHSNTNQSKFKRIGCCHLNSVCLVLKITLASRERAESSGTCCTRAGLPVARFGKMGKNGGALCSHTVHNSTDRQTQKGPVPLQ